MVDGGRGRVPKWVGVAIVLILVAAVLYLPARRELIDRGWVAAGTLVSDKGERLTIYGNGVYVSSGGRGTFKIERFPDAPWISMLRLSDGQTLHVKYEDRVYQVEDITRMEGADVVYGR
jgi:hypothetical protein